MKILITSTPGIGHINPMLAVGHMLRSEGHELSFLSGSWLRDRIERAGVHFRSFSGEADVDLRNLHEVAPELAELPTGFEWLRVALQRIFIDRIADQYRGLQQALLEFPADVIVSDDMMFGVLPMLMTPREERPPIVLCGTTILHWCRSDGAPNFLGLPPAASPADVERFALIADEYERLTNGPTMQHLNGVLRGLGMEPISLALFDAVIAHADAYLQLTVPSFEFPREHIPSTVSFVGTPPLIPGQAPLPPWASDLDGARKVVLVTQGTVANRDFGLLVEPTMAALANEPDILVVGTAGGRPLDAISGPIPANARLASYLPFEWLLPKVDVLVTNGGYGTVNQSMSAGIPLVTAGLTEDKADVNARVKWSGVGINLETNEPTPGLLGDAVRTVLDTPHYRNRARQMAEEFGAIDTRSTILRILHETARDSRTARLVAGRSRSDRAYLPAHAMTR